MGVGGEAPVKSVQQVFLMNWIPVYQGSFRGRVIQRWPSSVHRTTRDAVRGTLRAILPLAQRHPRVVGPMEMTKVSGASMLASR